MKRKTFVFLGAILLLCNLVLLSGKSEEESRVIHDPTKAITLSPHSVTIKRGQAYMIIATPAAPFNGSTVVWSSSDTSVGDVTQYGLVVGKKAGTAVITVTINDLYVGGYESYSDSCTVVVSSALIISSGTYIFRCVEAAKCADIEGPSSSNGAKIQIYPFENVSQRKWFLSFGSDGYYRIKSLYSSKYMGVTGNSASAGATITQTSSVGTGGKWSLMITSGGNYVFVPASSTSKFTVLDTPENSSGTDLITAYYSNNTDYKDEWLLAPPHNLVQLEAQTQGTFCWVAVARMLSYKYMLSPISQESAAVFVKLGIKTNTPSVYLMNSTISLGGTVTETRFALEYILGSENVYSKFEKIYSEQVLQGLLDAGNPVVLSRGFYNNNGRRAGGHCTVVYDYHWNSEYGVYVYDILDPSPVNVGSTYYESYQSICSGIAAYDGDINDHCIWDGIVVFKNGSYQNTIDWLGVQ